MYTVRIDQSEILYLAKTALRVNLFKTVALLVKVVG
jgi:hypothetical protein